MALEYSEVGFYSTMIFEKEADSFNNQLIGSAFMSWLTTDTKKSKFNDYLKMLGLAEREEPLNEEQKKILQARADNLVERILQADKQRNL